MAIYEDGTMDVVVNGVECRRPFDMVEVAKRLNGESVCVPVCRHDASEEYMYFYAYGDDRPHIVELQTK